MTDAEKPKPAPKTPFEEALENLKGGINPDVGYHRPPEYSRFKKGQSGNPNGRPKAAQDLGDRSSHALALREADRRISVREGDSVREITQIEAVHRAQYVSATKGSAYAQKHIIESYNRARRDKRKEIESEIEWWTNYRNVVWAEMTKARADGAVGSVFLIHPQDVVIDAEKGVSFSGPTSDQEAAELETTLALRDLMLMQDAWDSRNGRGEGASDVTVAGLIAVMLNFHVPARYQLSDVELVDRTSRWDRTTKRELRKLLFRASKRLGRDWKPGRLLPTISQFTERCKQVGEFVRQWARGEHSKGL